MVYSRTLVQSFFFLFASGFFRQLTLDRSIVSTRFLGMERLVVNHGETTILLVHFRFLIGIDIRIGAGRGAMVRGLGNSER
jgi:hypothetical protein